LFLSVVVAVVVVDVVDVDTNSASRLRLINCLSELTEVCVVLFVAVVVGGGDDAVDIV
jgi:hypothetical protein